MSYTRTPRAVTRVQQILEDLLRVDGAREWLARDSGKLAYQVREAFAAAERIPEFRRFAILRERFVIRSRDGKVIAEPRVKSPFEAPVATVFGKVSLEGISTAQQAIGAVIKHNIEEIHLPDFPSMPPDDVSELQLLFKWTSTNEIYIVNHFGAGITLTRRRPVPELEWTPPTPTSSQQ